MAILSKGNTFADGDQVTSTNLNNLVDLAAFVPGSSGTTDDATLEVNGSGRLQVKTIQTGNIANSAVTTAKIADSTGATNGITTAKIATGAVTTAKIADSTGSSDGVTTAKIADDAVTQEKIADAAVGTAQLIDANITAAKLNGAQTGTAPIYGIRAWVNFDGTTADNIGGTYSRTLTTVTVTTSVDHGLIVGHKVFLDFTSGAAVDGAFVVTGVTSSTIFTVTHGTSGSTSGNVTLNRRLIRASGNVSSVSLLETGKYAINFTVPLPNPNYARCGFANFSSGATAGLVAGNNATATTEQSCDINVANSANGDETNFTVVNVIFVG